MQIIQYDLRNVCIVKVDRQTDLDRQFVFPSLFPYFRSQMVLFYNIRYCVFSALWPKDPTLSFYLNGSLISSVVSTQRYERDFCNVIPFPSRKVFWTKSAYFCLQQQTTKQM